MLDVQFLRLYYLYCWRLAPGGPYCACSTAGPPHPHYNIIPSPLQHHPIPSFRPVWLCSDAGKHDMTSVLVICVTRFHCWLCGSWPIETYRRLERAALMHSCREGIGKASEGFVSTHCIMCALCVCEVLLNITWVYFLQRI